MVSKLRLLAIPLFIATLFLTPSTSHAQQTSTELSKRFLDDLGIRGGLIVYIGCGDYLPAATLPPGDNYVVHGLDKDPRAVDRARKNVRKLGLYGSVSIGQFDGKRLPYADNMVNLIVADDMGDLPRAEAMRVLAPSGKLYVRHGTHRGVTVKPVPGNTDEWTHYLHDAGGNAVAHDDVVGPPRHLQWLAGPRHARSHEHTPSINALVSAGGRIFYIADESSITNLREPARWSLVARDAYNGILLWKRSFEPWYPHIVNWGQFPYNLQRRLVAAGDRIYVTLGLHAPLSAVDAATGEILKIYDQTQGADEIILHKGVLLLVVRSVTDKRTVELDRMLELTVDKHSPLYARETAEPLVKRFRSTEMGGSRAILAIDASTGDLLWKKSGAEVSGLRPITLSAVGGRVFYQKGRDVVCRELKTGRQLWSVPGDPLRLVHEDVVICASGKFATALSIEAGKTLWTKPTLLTDVRDAFIAGGSLWVGGFKPIENKRSPAWGPYFATQLNLQTGKVEMHVEPENPGHHHRCWRNKATDRYILGGRRGVEYIDLKTGEVLWNSWVRGVCRYGVMPSNGLLYAPPHACGCYVAAKLTGFYTLAPESDSASAATASGQYTLERGPAYSRSSRSATSEAQWPTYRGDANRSGRTSSVVPADLTRKWQVNVGGKLTAPTVADGRVFVASVEEHRVCAIDADSGKSEWDFTTGARVDSPPTVHRGKAIFGCRDGCVYSLRASDGLLAWRLRTSGADRLVMAAGQLESISPVHGSVLIEEDAAYFTAGLSSYLDNGIDLYRIEPDTGKTLSVTQIYSPDPETGKQPAHYAPAYMPGSLSDILSSDDDHVYLRDAVLDKTGRRQEQGDPHLFTLTGYLDDSWPHRSYWIFGQRLSLSTGCSGQERNLTYGRLLVTDKNMVYGYGRKKLHWSNQLQDGPYRLFARDSKKTEEKWSLNVPIQVRAMVLAGKLLFVAGPHTETGREAKGTGGLLMVVSASDGRELTRYPLDCAPVFDGMAACDGRLYMSLDSGGLLCMDGK